MKLILSFDTEDYVTPEAADAQKWWAEQLEQRGLRGSFQVVGEVVRALRKRGRGDVLDALNRHETGCHTNYHSRPPTHPEALEGRSLEEGVEWVMKTEAAGWSVLESTFGRVPISYCSPGDSWTPATLVAYAAAGIKVTSDSRLRLNIGRPLWYCGLMLFGYNMAFDSFFNPDKSPEETFEERFGRIRTEIGEDGVMVIYSHPTRLVTSRFWDHPFYHAVRVPLEELPPAPLWPEEHRGKLEDDVRRRLDWLLKQSDVEFTDFSSVYAEYSADRRDLQALLNECGLAPGEEGKLPLREASGSDYLPPESFDRLGYHWSIHPEGFKGEKLLEMARKLAWTAAPVKHP